MAPWSFMRINYIPMTLGVVFTFGLTLCFVLSILSRHVSPYLPFISDTGGQFPEAGLFSIFLYLSSTMGLSAILVRFLIVYELNRDVDRRIDLMNKFSVVIGFIAMMGMVVVAAYPETSIGLAHGLGANFVFLGGVIYTGIQTALSFRMSPNYNGKRICYIRLAITIVGAIAFIVMTVMMSVGMYVWSTGQHQHNMTQKTPQDKGFYFLLMGSVMEWTMAISFLALFFTFIREFSKVCFHLRVQLLVSHFDEEPNYLNIAVASENTPIVM